MLVDKPWKIHLEAPNMTNHQLGGVFIKSLHHLDEQTPQLT